MEPWLFAVIFVGFLVLFGLFWWYLSGLAPVKYGKDVIGRLSTRMPQRLGTFEQQKSEPLQSLSLLQFLTHHPAGAKKPEYKGSGEVDVYGDGKTTARVLSFRFAAAKDKQLFSGADRVVNAVWLWRSLYKGRGTLMKKMPKEFRALKNPTQVLLEELQYGDSLSPEQLAENAYKPGSVSSGRKAGVRYFKYSQQHKVGEELQHKTLWAAGDFLFEVSSDDTISRDFVVAKLVKHQNQLSN